MRMHCCRACLAILRPSCTLTCTALCSTPHIHRAPHTLQGMSAQELASLPRVGTAVPLVFGRRRTAGGGGDSSTAAVAAGDATRGRGRSGPSQPPAAGSWVKLRNVGARVVQGQLQAYFHRHSRWAAWPQGERQVMATYEARLAAQAAGESAGVAGWAPRAPANLLARCIEAHRHRPLSTLRQVLADTPAATPRMYRVLARCVEWAPQDAAHMCHPAQQCGLQGAPGAELAHEWMRERWPSWCQVVAAGPAFAAPPSFLSFLLLLLPPPLQAPPPRPGPSP